MLSTDYSPKVIKNIGFELAALKAIEVPVGNNRTAKLETLPIVGPGAIAKPHIEAVRETWRKRTGHAKANRVATNRMLRRVRAVFNWGIESGYVTETPFKRNGVTLIRLDHKAEEPRTRRLEDGEERKLLDHAATQHLKDLIIAALDSGMRLGELLSLQWSQVTLKCAACESATACTHVKKQIHLPASKTKTGKARTVPLSQRLMAVLEMRRLGPDGQPFGPSAFVFGNDVGEPVKSIREAWTTTVLKAHGYQPKHRGKLSASSREALGAIGLHVHDLRREGASRFLEAGMPLNVVSTLLGHASVTMTARYLATTLDRLEREMAKLDTFHEEQARRIVQSFVHDSSTEPTAESPQSAAHIH